MWLFIVVINDTFVCLTVCLTSEKSKREAMNKEVETC